MFQIEKLLQMYRLEAEMRATMFRRAGHLLPFTSFVNLFLENIEHPPFHAGLFVKPAAFYGFDFMPLA